jgi:hypothetical protein
LAARLRKVSAIGSAGILEEQTGIAANVLKSPVHSAAIMNTRMMFTQEGPDHTLSIGEVFKQIVRVVWESRRDTNPFSYLNNPYSAINNPYSEPNNRYSKYNNPYNSCNSPYGSRKVRRVALKELLDKYLSDYLSEELRNELADKYV